MSNENDIEDITPVRTFYVENYKRENAKEIDLIDIGEVIKTIVYADGSPIERRKISFGLIIYKGLQAVKEDADALQPDHRIVELAPEDANLPTVDNSIPNSNDSILKLNDDCISNLFSQSNLSDQITLSELCDRLAAIGEIEFEKVKRIHIYVTKFATSVQREDILNKVSRYIEYITFQGVSYSYRIFVHNGISLSSQYLDYCTPDDYPNLRNLQFNKIHVTYNIIEQLFPVLIHLKSLVLRTCYITDNIIKILKYCRKLEKLDLSFNTITGVGLETLSNTIMNLNLAFCNSIEKPYFTKLFEVAKFRQISFPDIYRIDLGKLSKVESIQSISLYNSLNIDLRPIASLPHLKEIFINCNEADVDDTFLLALKELKSDILEKLWLPCARVTDLRRNIISKFKNLKDLCITVDDKFLKVLAKNNVNLTSLNVFGSTTISVTELLDFVDKSKCIKLIDLTLCIQFDNSFVQLLLKKLENLHRKTRLELIVTRTGIHPALLSDEYKRLLKLSILTETSRSNAEYYLYYGYGPGYGYAFNTNISCW